MCKYAEMMFKTNRKMEKQSKSFKETELEKYVDK